MKLKSAAASVLCFAAVVKLVAAAAAGGFATNLPSITAQDPVRVMSDQMAADYLARHTRAMHFYGLVVDDNSRPIKGAVAQFSKTQTGETPPRQTDAAGRFELSGVSGRYLNVDVSKSGYYPTSSSRQSFDFSPAGGNFQADSSNPVVFRLRQRGPGVELITSQRGVNPDFGFSPPRDASPVWVDFLGRKVAGIGQMEVCKTTLSWDGNHAPKEWWMRLAIPDGGFVRHDDEFPFTAPAAGYEPVLEFHFRPGDTNWTDAFKGQYYVAFGTPPTLRPLED